LDASRIRMMRFLPVHQLALHEKFYTSGQTSIHLFRYHVSRIMGLSYA
jgi:hypothetical protein